MKKLILPLLMIFLTVTAFGQAKKEAPTIKVEKKDLKQVDFFPMSEKKMKKLKGNPAFSKFWSCGPKGIKPKAGYGLLTNEKGQLITWKQGNNAWTSGQATILTFTTVHVTNAFSMPTGICAFAYDSVTEKVYVMDIDTSSGVE